MVTKLFRLKNSIRFDRIKRPNFGEGSGEQYFCRGPIKCNLGWAKSTSDSSTTTVASKTHFLLLLVFLITTTVRRATNDYRKGTPNEIVEVIRYFGTKCTLESSEKHDPRNGHISSLRSHKYHVLWSSNTSTIFVLGGKCFFRSSVIRAAQKAKVYCTHLIEARMLRPRTSRAPALFPLRADGASDCRHIETAATPSAWVL